MVWWTIVYPPVQQPFFLSPDLHSKRQVGLSVHRDRMVGRQRGWVRQGVPLGEGGIPRLGSKDGAGLWAKPGGTG